MLTADTVRKTLHDLYSYEVSDTDAQAIANGAGPIFTLSQHLKALTLDDVSVPFSYPVIAAEAARLAKLKR
ncbi:MAG TPA: hypothetical protein VMA09_19740 [Candidatus Binataceae bacterium]|nr:hypothetical protein [Candidatus Binataceae bacterium]